MKRNNKTALNSRREPIRFINTYLTLSKCKQRIKSRRIGVIRNIKSRGGYKFVA